MEALNTVPASDSEAKLVRLFEAHYDEVLAYCIRRIGRSDADEVALDVFVVAWRRLDEVDWSTARPWIFGITRGVLANRWRTIRRQGQLRDRLYRLVPTETVDLFLVDTDASDKVVNALRKLRPRDQEILMLAAWEELSAKEIAAALQISVSATEQRLHRAKARLATRLEPKLRAPDASLDPNSGGR